MRLTDEAVAADAAASRLNWSPLGSPVLPINRARYEFRTAADDARGSAAPRPPAALHSHTSSACKSSVSAWQCTRRESNALSSLASSMPSDLYSDLINALRPRRSHWPRDRTSLPLAPSPVTALHASPILRYLELHWSQTAVQVDIKTRSPIPDTFTEVLSSYDNHISSLDVSLTIAQRPIAVLLQCQEADRCWTSTASSSTPAPHPRSQ